MKFTKEEADEIWHDVKLKRADLAIRFPESYGLTKDFYDKLLAKIEKLREKG